MNEIKVIREPQFPFKMVSIPDDDIPDVFVLPHFITREEALTIFGIKENK